MDFISCFKLDEDFFGRTTFWLSSFGNVDKLGGLVLEIEPCKRFQSNEGKTIEWSPIQVVCAPDPQRLPILQTLVENSEKYKRLCVEEQQEQFCT